MAFTAKFAYNSSLRPLLCQPKHQFDEARPCIYAELGIDLPDLGANCMETCAQVIRHFLRRTTFQQYDSRIAEEVISHLAGLVGANVMVTIEVDAAIPGGVPDNVVRTVTENSRTLKFTSQGFEKE